MKERGDLEQEVGRGALLGTGKVRMYHILFNKFSILVHSGISNFFMKLCFK